MLYRSDMKTTFKDFYKQIVYVHNETVSGNVRIIVKTHLDLNKVCTLKEEEMPITTDISLNQKQLAFLISALQMMIDEGEA